MNGPLAFTFLDLLIHPKLKKVSNLGTWDLNFVEVVNKFLKLIKNKQCSGNTVLLDVFVQDNTLTRQIHAEKNYIK